MRKVIFSNYPILRRGDSARKAILKSFLIVTFNPVINQGVCYKKRYIQSCVLLE